VLKVGKADFAKAKLGDDITEEKCRNPKCLKEALKMVGTMGKERKRKVVECQSCFWRCVAQSKEELIFRKGDEF
jgi:hypothetical protein